MPKWHFWASFGLQILPSWVLIPAEPLSSQCGHSQISRSLSHWTQSNTRGPRGPTQGRVLLTSGHLRESSPPLLLLAPHQQPWRGQNREPRCSTIQEMRKEHWEKAFPCQEVTVRESLWVPTGSWRRPLRVGLTWKSFFPLYQSEFNPACEGVAGSTTVPFQVRVQCASAPKESRGSKPPGQRGPGVGQPTCLVNDLSISSLPSLAKDVNLVRIGPLSDVLMATYPTGDTEGGLDKHW